MEKPPQGGSVGFRPNPTLPTNKSKEFKNVKHINAFLNHQTSSNSPTKGGNVGFKPNPTLPTKTHKKPVTNHSNH